MSAAAGEHFDVVIVGAGLAGLAAARVVQAAGRTVTVLERSDGVGGRVRTDHVEGFTLDRGFQVLLTAYPEAHRQLDLGALRLQHFEPGALVWHRSKGHVVGDPFRRPSTLLSTVLAPIGSPLDKLRVLRMRRRVRTPHPALLLGGDDTTTIGALRAEGFSDTAIDRFLRPLFAGIQLDPSLHTSRRMFDVILRSLSDGSSAVPAAGMSAISEQMAAHLAPGAVRLNAEVAEVSGTTATLTDGTTAVGRALLVAAEGPAAAALLGLPEIGSHSVGCVYFAADRAPVHHKLVVLDASSEGPALNVAVMSNVAPSYAPPGEHLVAAALPGVVDGDLEAAARQQLRGWWGPQVDAWRHLRTYRITHGQPDQSPPFSPKRPVALGGNVFVAGDHRDTGSIQGAMYSGRRCGEAVVTATAALP